MAHYAWIDENNIVINVTTGVDEDVIEENIGGSTEAWEDFYTQAINQHGIYVKRTSYNSYGGVHKSGGTPFRKNYAGIGFTYDVERDAFIPQKPYDSWLLDENTCLWKSPVEYPNDGLKYTWDENTKNWVVYVSPES